MSRSLADLAAMKTLTEQVVDRLAGTHVRVTSTLDLQTRVDSAKKDAAAAPFGNRNLFLVNAAEDLDRMILGARQELGILTPTMDDHLERLALNGPWLEDLDVPDSRGWPVEEIVPGQWASVHHELRLLGSLWGNPDAPLGNSQRRDEAVLRRMRARYDEHFGLKAELQTDAGGPTP